MTKDEVKNELIRSLQGMEVSENEELDERAEKVTIGTRLRKACQVKKENYFERHI